jgi:hypothetical protein
MYNSHVQSTAANSITYMNTDRHVPHTQKISLAIKGVQGMYLIEEDLQPSLISNQEVDVSCPRREVKLASVIQH